MFYLVEVTEPGPEFHRVFLTDHDLDKGRVWGRKAVILAEFEVSTFEVARMLVDDTSFVRVPGHGFFNH